MIKVRKSRIFRALLRLQKSLAGCDKFLNGADEAVGLGVADHDVERHEAAAGDPDAGRRHVEEEQLLGVLAAGRDVGRRPDRPVGRMCRHHRADAGELEGDAVLLADRVQPRLSTLCKWFAPALRRLRWQPKQLWRKNVSYLFGQ